MKKVSFSIMLLSLLTGILVCSPSLQTVEANDPVYFPQNNHYYQAITVQDNLTWAEAKSQAEALYYSGYAGHLATITSEAENDFVIDNLGGPVMLNRYWLGGFQPPNSSEPSGNWQWITGEPWDYTNWAWGEPTNSYGGEWGGAPVGSDEEKLHFWGETGVWNDMEETSVQPGFIVEYDEYMLTGWKPEFNGPTNHPIVDFAVYNGSLYAAADSRLYAYDGNSWTTIDAPTFVTSLEAANVTNKQPAQAEWNRTYGGLNMDVARDVIQTADDGYVLAGSTWSFGSGTNDFWLVRTDSSGNIQWNQTYGGTGVDEAYALVQTADGGYAFVGHTQSFGAGEDDVWLVKTDANGNMEWNMTIGGTSSDRAHDLVQTNDGGYALVGYTFSYGSAIGEFCDYWLVKTDADGTAVWNMTYGGGSHDIARSLILTSDGGYALAGEGAYLGAGGIDMWLVRTDVSGNMLWNKTFGGSFHDWAEALVQTSDGGYALAGTYSNTGWGDYYFWLVRTDSSGNMEWNRTYERMYTANAHALVQTGDGGFALVGEIFLEKSGQWDPDYWLVKTDASGNALWNQTYGGIYSDVAYAVVLSEGGSYVLAGRAYSQQTSSDFWLVKTELRSDFEENLVVGGKGGLYYYDSGSFDLIFSLPTYIKALGVYNNILYAGTMLDTLPKLYYCNGSADHPSDWHADSGFSEVLNFSGVFGSIDSLAVYNQKMYVASGKTVYSFDGTSWSVTLSYEYAYAFLDMQVYGGKLYLATGDQNRIPIYAGGTGFSGTIIEFDGENWTTVLGHDYWIYCLEECDSKLYVGTANRIYTYNGTDWDVSFYSEEGASYAISMITYDGTVYAGMGNGHILTGPIPENSTLSESPLAITEPEYPSTMLAPPFAALPLTLTALLKKRSRRKSKM